jgi:transcriptional regulator with XRE-family HTH domain
MEAWKILSWNLQRLRVEKGLSQERLAFAAGIDRAYVGRVERGSENVTITTLKALAVVLTVRVADLLTEPEPGATRPIALGAGRRPKHRPTSTPREG